MTNNHLTLFCLIDGETTSNAFPVEIESSKTIGDLKKLIKTEQAPAFDDITANNLTLWKVSLSISDDEEETFITLDAFSDKKKLQPTNRLSRLFVEPQLEDTIHIIVQRPSPPPSGIICLVAASHETAGKVCTNLFCFAPLCYVV